MNKLITMILAFYPFIRTISDKTSGKLWDILLVVLIIKIFLNKNNLVKMFIFIVIFFITFINSNMNFFLNESAIKEENLKFLLVITMLLVGNDKNLLCYINYYFDKYKKIILVSNITSLLMQYIAIFVNKKVFIKHGVIEIYGTTASSHMLGYLMFSITVIAVYLAINNKEFIYKIPVLLCIPILILLDARTIMMANLIIASIMLIKLKDIKLSSKIIMLLSGLFIIIIIFNLDLPFKAKAEYANETSSILSGRDIFWKSDIEYYKNSNLIRQFLGNGLGTTNYVNKTTYNMNIWAHNDFIEILVNRGVFVLFIYILLLLNYIQKVYKYNEKYTAICICISMFLLINLNGFYAYIIPTMYLPILLSINNKILN